ncbi:hypothetical protein ASPZODRAFT_19674 [Penicilliopsis zonata CBS 506.65]|uniref:Uncharacterized protein n=1 Tax=Penicilliopsis zonata CBS 506.65 TaxID=1073090 RepID=A0A1L9S7Z9_9EURO|nr:hypothetical protein ASPZODRAFT_19674 [Penicilliopsis zonata CBS 506.65]OJJ43271.1 hypothetical protein ASPZODRAFT_19674 [Penicilliopsis zonata CBS 506.65]
MSGSFKFINSEAPVPGDGGGLPAQFSVTAPPSTDVWAKPPATRPFNAPILYRSIPLAKFKRVRVAFNAAWKDLYDQGGLILLLDGADESKRKWVKSGIEFTHGKPHLSTVVKDRWADWSLLPVPSGGALATLEMVREDDGSLWVYLVEGVQKSPIREVTWVFDGEDDVECWVGVYAARPSEKKGDLEVHFGHLMIELLE